jgi:hypothetical protein
MPALSDSSYGSSASVMGGEMKCEKGSSSMSGRLFSCVSSLPVSTHGGNE